MWRRTNILFVSDNLEMCIIYYESIGAIFKTTFCMKGLTEPGIATKKTLKSREILIHNTLFHIFNKWVGTSFTVHIQDS